MRELVKRDERIDRLARTTRTWATRTQRPAQIRRFLAQDGPHRVLVPGGRIRLATPNIDKVLQLAASAPGRAEADYVAWSNEAFGESLDPVEIDATVHAVNRLFRQRGHRFLHSPELLVRDLERAGFSSISKASVGASDDVDFDGIDFQGETVSDCWNRFSTMVFEAEKS